MARSFDLLALTLPAALDAAVAIAAARAGEWGVLDLEYAPEALAGQAAAELARHARAPFGLKLNCRQDQLLERLLAAGWPNWKLAIVVSDDLPASEARLAEMVSILRARGLRVLLEVTHLDQARRGVALGVDGLIAKGNEAGGFVGEETAFVLLQHLRRQISLPIYVQGGIGLHTAAACYAAGAAGVVLDSQLALARESRLSADVRERLAAMDGSETLCLGAELGAQCRIYFRPGLPVAGELRREEERLLDALADGKEASADGRADELRAAWRRAVRERVGTRSSDQQILLIGQEAAWADRLARRFVTVSGILKAIREAALAHLAAAARLQPLVEDGPLARAHGTRYPIVQGPMTRVSDTPAFAAAVANEGGLPLLALALLSRQEAMALLAETRRQVGEHPWGVGILGFVPLAVRQQQLEAIRVVRPPFVLIAGGRPDQARALEAEGIATYLHVPSPELLRLFLAEGARRFVFEGRECGGHVGPRSSFVLWEQMVETLLEHLNAHPTDTAAALTGADLHILFAGGIHDAMSAAMAAVLAAPLIERGVRFGVLVGTAYLFTKEAVACGAIVQRYQDEAIRGQGTILLETGLGHTTRCLPTPFVRAFNEHKRRLQREQATPERLREELEALNLGRLRIASKGIVRNPLHERDPQAPRYVARSEDEQYAEGMYMIGQVAALRDQVVTIAELHAAIAQGSAQLLADLASRAPTTEAEPPASPSRIAIVGMAALLPGARDVRAYWENILNRVDAVTEIPLERFDWRRYYDPDRNARDKMYSRWGGFIGDIPFNPLDYGMPPSSLRAIEPMQLLMLEVARAALADAGYRERPFPRERTAVIVAAGGGLGDLGYHYGFRSYLPHFFDAASDEVIARLAAQLPEWTEDSFPGILLNVVAGRVANRLDLGGPNFIVDAACGSSLAALDSAVKDLETGRTDMAIVGGADTVQSPFAFLAFSKTQALSPSGRSRPFDVDADGIAISEGVAAVVLKRLADAERDGDRIYAVIQGIGASSDGKDKGLTAPRPIGQLRALRRAYAKAGIAPQTVGLIEAHATGTRVGDVAEAEALHTLLSSASLAPRSIAIGSVKSMIGHTKSTAGLASLIKTALALYHKVLPPTLVQKPNPAIFMAESPLYVNSETRPWLTARPGQARRAGVSAFGFGGTNFHAVLEEYTDAYLVEEAPIQTWPAELVVLAGEDRAALAAEIEHLRAWLTAGDPPSLRDVAYTLAWRRRPAHGATGKAGVRLAIVATSLADLDEKLSKALARLNAGETEIRDAQGIYGSAAPGVGENSIAFVFPGQGSQAVNMVRDLALCFPQVRAQFERANHLLRDQFARPLSDYIFPPPADDKETIEAQRQALTDTRVAQPALGAAELAIARLLGELGVRPAAVAGHSYGEIVALHVAGVIDEAACFAISAARGRFMAEAAGPEAGTMAAVRGDRATVAEVIQGIAGVTLANLNSPQQTVISGTREAVQAAMQRLQERKLRSQLLSVACAFHSPLVSPARDRLAQVLSTLPFGAPEIAVYSNTLGAAYPAEPERIREILAGHLAQPVEWQAEVEAMYAAGLRVFIEAGPRTVLTGLIGQILGERPHLAVAIDSGGPGILALLRGLGQLAAAGVVLDWEPLYAGRGAALLDLSQPYRDPMRARYGPSTWIVNGGRARPWQEVAQGLPEPTVQPLSVRLADASPAASQIGPPADAATFANTTPTTLPPPSAAYMVPPPNAKEEASPSQIRSGEPSADLVADEDRVGVMARYQEVMAQFLQVQQRIVAAYLAGDEREAVRESASVNSASETGGSLPDPTALTDELAVSAAVPLTMPACAPAAIERYRLTIVAAPWAGTVAPLTAALAPGRVVVITDDGRGVATGTAALLRQQGVRAILAAAGATAVRIAEDRYQADFADPASVQELLALIHQDRGPVSGLLHLAPLGNAIPFDQIDLAGWRRAIESDVIGLFHLTQALYSDLAAASQAGGACLLAATCLGGGFGSDGAEGFCPHQGGVAGFLKTAALEMPEMRVKAVDLSQRDAAAEQAQWIVREMGADDGLVEVGYQDGQRRRLALVPAPVATEGEAPLPLDPHAVVLVTGGARGITALVAQALAERCQPRLIIVGRSPLPAEVESAATAGLTAPAEIKAALLQTLGNGGPRVPLSEVEAAYTRLMHARAMRANLAALRQAGAIVEYHALDVRDATALAALIDDIYRRWGRLDGVIHGAGIVEDKLIPEKTPQSFARVLSTKVDSAFMLSRKLDPTRLRFLVFFSSVSGRFGNRGQSDYAAANEILNKLAVSLDRCWPGRVVAINWGPWDAPGMVSDELRHDFARRGVSLVPAAEGVRRLLDELSSGRKGEAEVLICSADTASIAESRG